VDIVMLLTDPWNAWGNNRQWVVDRLTEIKCSQECLDKGGCNDGEAWTIFNREYEIPNLKHQGYWRGVWCPQGLLCPNGRTKTAAFHAYRQLFEKTYNFSNVEDAGGLAEVRLFRISAPQNGQDVYVAWRPNGARRVFKKANLTGFINNGDTAVQIVTITPFVTRTYENGEPIYSVPMQVPVSEVPLSLTPLLIEK